MLNSPANDTGCDSDTLSVLLGGLLTRQRGKRHSVDSNVEPLRLLGGIAIVGNRAEPSHGSWQWSTPSEPGWNCVQGVSQASALLLPASSRLRYVATRPFQEGAPALLVRLVDWSRGRVLVTRDVDIRLLNGGNSAIGSTVIELSCHCTPRYDGATA